MGMLWSQSEPPSAVIRKLNRMWYFVDCNEFDDLRDDLLWGQVNTGIERLKPPLQATLTFRLMLDNHQVETITHGWHQLA